MLEITLPPQELWSDETEEFIDTPAVLFKLEHSLYTISKWEAKYKKSFVETFKKDSFSYDEIIDYIRCMTTNDVPSDIYNYITVDFYKTVIDYMSDSMTATVITHRKDEPKRPSKQFITSELLYSYMVGYRVPWECEHWHLNRLLILLDILSIQNDPKGNKMPNKDILKNNSMENARRMASRAKSGMPKPHL